MLMRGVFIAGLFAGAMNLSAWADVIEIQLPLVRSSRPIMIQGEIKYNQGGSVTFTHPKLGVLYLDPENVINKYKAKTPRQIFALDLQKAKKTGKADEVMKAAIWALHKGLLKEFYDSLGDVLKLDPQHKEAQRVLRLREEVFNKPVTADVTAQESYMRKKVRNSNMKVELSNHFMLLHDTPDRLPEGDLRKVVRAKSRVQLLEQVYETFLLKFYAQGVELEIPKERLMVVLFNDHKNYLTFATSLDPELQGASGFYMPTVNMAFFFDHGTIDPELKSVMKKLKEEKKEAIRNKDKDLVRLVNALDFLVTVDSENSDISVVSHECTHQMAANTGLFPRQVMIPAWVHEGLATYFEAPGDATWAGIGAVNEERIEFYRVLANQRDISNIDFIVGDKIFKHAANLGATLHGYAQAWALTHFLVENHFDKLMIYYRRIGEFPPDTMLAPDVLIEVFHDVFKEEMGQLESDWRIYMGQMQTDMEKIKG